MIVKEVSDPKLDVEKLPINGTRPMQRGNPLDAQTSPQQVTIREKAFLRQSPETPFQPVSAFSPACLLFACPLRIRSSARFKSRLTREKETYLQA